MVRLVSTLSAAVMLFAPLAAAAQQVSLNFDPAVLQQFTQLQQQSTSTVGFQLQQDLQQYLPVAQTYLTNLTASGDTEAIIARLEMMLQSPSTTGANQPLIDTLLAQVAVLQAQINALLTGGSATSTASSTPILIEFPEPASSMTASGICPVISRLLQFGASGTDVTNLQQFLITVGFLEAENATGFFGSLTQAAVQEWQAANGIVSGGTPQETGFGVVGPRTRVALENCTA